MKIESLDFKKMNGLIPTIVKDEQGNILMLAYSNKESLKRTLETKKACYFSRKRKKIWAKGKTSGNTQKIIKIKIDCDKDALLFVVKQRGKACHLNRYSCFREEKKFDLKELYRTIEERAKSRAEDSYSYKLYKNPKLLNKRIIEEANELIRTKNKRQVIWETADLLYFLLAFLVKRKVNLNQIENKLGERNKNAEKLEYYRKRCKKRRLRWQK